VEGNNRKSKKELFRFIDIALGSPVETEYLLMFSKKMGFVKKDTSEIENLISEVGKLLGNFQKS
jgi:four helix bundle protein